MSGTHAAQTQTKENARMPLGQGKHPGRYGSVELGARLRELRLARGLGVRAVARRTGLSPGTVSLLEHAKRRVRASTLRRLAGVLAPVRPDVLTELRYLAGSALVEPESIWPDWAQRLDAARERRSVVS